MSCTCALHGNTTKDIWTFGHGSQVAVNRFCCICCAGVSVESAYQLHNNSWCWETNVNIKIGVDSCMFPLYEYFHGLLHDWDLTHRLQVYVWEVVHVSGR
jgi:hypothetical protein